MIKIRSKLRIAYKGSVKLKLKPKLMYANLQDRRLLLLISSVADLKFAGARLSDTVSF